MCLRQCLLVAGLTFAACAAVNGARIPVVAEIDGEDAVTYSDLARYFETALPGTVITPDDVARLTDDIISARILVAEAEKAGLGADPYLVSSVEAQKNWLFWDKAVEYILKDEDVAEEELRAFYETDLHWRKYSVLTARNQADAEAARAALEGGVPWEEAVAKFSVFPETVRDDGVMAIPMIYDARPAAVALFSTAVGEYSPAIIANDDIRWQVYRSDKIVHGRGDTFDVGRAGILTAIRGLRLARKQKEIAAELRARVPAKRDAAAWDALQNGPFAYFLQNFNSRDVVISDVGGVPVSGFDFCYALTDYLWPSPEPWDEYRQKDPGDFAYVTDSILRRLENNAYTSYYAREQGLDHEPSFVRAVENYRAGLLMDALTVEGFFRTLPPITDEQCQAYFDAHADAFQTPEAVEVYLIALPDRKRTLEFYGEIRKNGDVVKTGEDYIHALGIAMMDMPEQPPEIPFEKQEWFGVVQVLKEPNAADPDKVFAAELRPRVYPITPLKTLSEVFQLKDGRWAFYAPIYHQPFVQHTLDDPSIKSRCQRMAWNEYAASPEVDVKSREWVAALRTQHKIIINAGLYAKAAEWLNNVDRSEATNP